MLEKYYRFDTEKFYSEFHNNIKILADLEKKHENLWGINSVNLTVPRVSGGQINDSTFQIVKKREELEEKIENLKRYFRVEKLIYDSLEENEKHIADYLKMPKERQNVLALSEKLGFSTTWTYQFIRETKRKIEDIAVWYT